MSAALHAAPQTRLSAIACTYAKVLSKRRLSHRPFPEDIGIYSIILIRALSRSRGFCFLAAQWPDSLHATVRAFPERQEVAEEKEGDGKRERWDWGGSKREKDTWRARERRRDERERTRARAAWHVIPVTVIAVRYYSTANVIHLWFNEKSRETAAVRPREDVDCAPSTAESKRNARWHLGTFRAGWSCEFLRSQNETIWLASFTRPAWTMSLSRYSN